MEQSEPDVFTVSLNLPLLQTHRLGAEERREVRGRIRAAIDRELEHKAYVTEGGYVDDVPCLIEIHDSELRRPHNAASLAKLESRITAIVERYAPRN